jgi:hypothetical protein
MDLGVSCFSLMRCLNSGFSLKGKKEEGKNSIYDKISNFKLSRRHAPVQTV